MQREPRRRPRPGRSSSRFSTWIGVNPAGSSRGASRPARQVHRGRSSRRLVEVVVADKDVVAGASLDGDASGDEPGLVLVCPRDEDAHRRRRGEVRAPEDLELDRLAIEDAGVEHAAGRAEGNGDVGRAEGAVARDDRPQRPAGTAIGRDVDRRVRPARRRRREGGTDDLGRGVRVDRNARLAVLARLAAQRGRDHVDNGDGHVRQPPFVRSASRTCTGW